MRYFDPETNESYIPYVVETSVGLDRLFLAVLSRAYHEEKLDDGTEQVVLRIPPVLAPVKVAVLPLIKKDGLPEKAREQLAQLQLRFNCQYDEKDSIGKRYRRQDALGTPFCVTIDHESLTDGQVTIRHRDSMEQERIPMNEVAVRIAQSVDMAYALQQLQ